jgi:hypothetical protein
MNNRVVIIGVLFAALLVLIVVLSIRNKETKPHYEDLDVLLSARYGNDYEIVGDIPYPVRKDNKFILHDHLARIFHSA